MAKTSRQALVRVEHLSKYFGAGQRAGRRPDRHQHGGLSGPGCRADGPERFGQDNAAELYCLHSGAEQWTHHARWRDRL